MVIAFGLSEKVSLGKAGPCDARRAIDDALFDDRAAAASIGTLVDKCPRRGLVAAL